MMRDDTIDPLLKLGMAIFVGAVMAYFVGLSSSFVTNDDYFHNNARSLFSDGRFVTGMVYGIFRGAFGPDVNFRGIVSMFAGMTTFLALISIGRLCIQDLQKNVLFSGFSVAIFGAAQFLFFYDMVPLYYLIAMPIIALWANVLERQMERPRARTLVLYALTTTAAIALILATLQVIFYLLFVVLAALLLLSERDRQRNLFWICVISVAAFVVAFASIHVFTRSDLYVSLFGFELRARTSGELIGDGTLLGLVPAFASAAIKLPIFAGNTVGLHVFLIAFVMARLLRNGWSQSTLPFLKFALLLFAIYLSPFLMFKETLENVRVTSSIYVYGSIALFLVAFALIDDERDDRIVSPGSALLFAAIATAIVATLIPSGEQQFATFAGLILLSAVLAAMAFTTTVSATVALTAAILIFTGVELRKAQSLTERYQSYAVVDQIIVSKMNEAIIENLYKYGTSRIAIEFGIRDEVIPHTSFRSQSYSSADFWRGTFWLPSMISFKRNDDLCAAPGSDKVFNLIESTPGSIKFCV
ncbi:MAG: hypothetical protein RLO21_04245 [Nitratireductor sp.]